MNRPPTLPRRWTLAAAIVLAVVACSDEPGPTQLESEALTPEVADGPTQAFEGNSVFDERAHRFPAEEFDLVSDDQELARGTYRFRPTTGERPSVSRDDFIIAPADGDEMTVRRVLGSRVEDGEVVVETGHAYWHEVIRSGTYTVTMPLDGRGEGRFVTDGPDRASYTFNAGQMEMPPLEAHFDDTDVCFWVHEVLAYIPGSATREVCGKEVEMSVAYGASVSVAGTLDSLKIVDGWLRLTGEADIATTVDGGSISGGRAPVFTPCNRGAFAGCLATPTGANLIDFLRRYAPTIPEASLPAIRICIPGTPVRVQRGYWSGWTWHPPVFEQCRVSDRGELPTIVLPSVTAATNEVRPRVQGEMRVRVKGDGVFALEIPIPFLSLGSWGWGVTNDLKAALKVGGFLLIKASLLNGGGTVRFVFDDTGRVTQTWTNAAGWDHDFELTDKSNHMELLEIDNPDSVVIRVGVPLKVQAEVCIAITACGETEEEGGGADKEARENGFELQILGKDLFGGSGFNIGAKAGVGVSMFEEATYTRDQIHPDSADIDNWHLSVDGAYDLHVEAGIKIPLTGWILPNVPREYENTWECCRVSMADYWGQGRIQVITTTSGADVDADGYKVLVERADSIPAVLDPGAQLIGDGWRPIVHEEAIPISGDVMFGPAVMTPCIGVYSDAFIVGNPVWGLSVAGARAAGVGIPTYGVTSPCRWLIGRYIVTLTDVAENCTVVDGAVRDSVWLQQRRTAILTDGIVQEPTRGDTTLVHFAVDCAPAGPRGSLEVVLTPGARAPDVTPRLLIQGADRGGFVEGDTLTIAALRPGTWELSIGDLNPNCTSDPVPFTIVADQLTSVTPPVTCVLPPPEPGTLTLSSSLTGEGPDANGYRIMMDGLTAAYLPVDGAGAVTDLPASTPTVIMVTDIAGNCQPQEPNPVLVTLDGAQTPVEMPFPVRCVDAKPDTLVGTVDASGYPIPTVTMRASDGTTLVVNGPKAGELARLTGTSVRVWGQTSATGINVHGYDLRSTLGDDRWLGIVLARPDGTWLFGEEAIRMVDPPPSLTAASGNLVWVMGQEVEGGVRPTLYGVIRGGGE